MENFLASRQTVTKLGGLPKTTANLFASLANRGTSRLTAPSPSEQVIALPAVEGQPHEHETKVELIRENGEVQRIVVVCKCGERIELDCVY